MVVEEEEFENMSEEQYMQHIKDQQESGIIQAQAEGRGPVPDVSLGQALHREVHDYGKDHVPHQTGLAWGVFAKQHPAMSNFDAMESFKMKSLVRQYEILLSTALPRGIRTPKLMRKIFQGRALAYMNISKGKNGFEAQMTRTSMVGVAGFNKPSFNPNLNRGSSRPRSRWESIKGVF